MAQAVAPDWLLIVVTGPDLGQRFLLAENPVTIGRGRDDSFIVHDPAVTHHQMMIEWDPIAARHYLQVTGDSYSVINNIPLRENARIKHELMEGIRSR